MDSFLVFFYILEQCYILCHEDDLGGFLGAISPEIWEYGKPIDIAVYNDWQNQKPPEIRLSKKRSWEGYVSIWWFNYCRSSWKGQSWYWWKVFPKYCQWYRNKGEVWQYNRNKIKRLANRKFYRYINPKFIHVNKYSQI